MRLATRGLNSFELNAKRPYRTEDVAKKSFSFFGTKAENTNNKKNVSKLKKSNVQSKITPKKKVSAGKKAITKKYPKKNLSVSLTCLSIRLIRRTHQRRYLLYQMKKRIVCQKFKSLISVYQTLYN